MHLGVAIWSGGSGGGVGTSEVFLTSQVGQSSELQRVRSNWETCRIFL